MQGAGDVQVILQIVLAGLQRGDAPATEFVEEMNAGHVCEFRRLTGTKPAGIEKLRGHSHAGLALELAFGNVEGAEERLRVGDAERFHGQNL